MEVPTQMFKRLSLGIIHRCTSRKFKAFFGLDIVARVWVFFLLPHINTYHVEPIHLLWMLYFIKVYPTADVLSSILKHDRKTLMKWIFTTLFLLYKSLTQSNLVCSGYVLTLCPFNMSCR